MCNVYSEPSMLFKYINIIQKRITLNKFEFKIQFEIKTIIIDSFVKNSRNLQLNTSKNATETRTQQKKLKPKDMHRNFDTLTHTKSICNLFFIRSVPFRARKRLSTPNHIPKRTTASQGSKFSRAECQLVAMAHALASGKCLTTVYI